MSALERFGASQLAELCQALGWQGGTYHAVLAEVKRLAADVPEPSLFDISNSELLLMVGEMTAQELRTVRAVLNGLKVKAARRAGWNACLAAIAATAEESIRP